MIEKDNLSIKSILTNVVNEMLELVWTFNFFKYMEYIEIR